MRICRRRNRFERARQQRRRFFELASRLAALVAALEVRAQSILFVRRGGADRIECGNGFVFFVRHHRKARKRSRSFFIPSCIRVLIVPNGSLSRCAISDCDIPSK